MGPLARVEACTRQTACARPPALHCPPAPGAERPAIVCRSRRTQSLRCRSGCSSCCRIARTHPRPPARCPRQTPRHHHLHRPCRWCVRSAYSNDVLLISVKLQNGVVQVHLLVRSQEENPSTFSDEIYAPRAHAQVNYMTVCAVAVTLDCNSYFNRLTSTCNFYFNLWPYCQVRHCHGPFRADLVIVVVVA